MNKIYLCGPITGCEDKADHNFSAAMAYLQSQEWSVVNPMAVTNMLPRCDMNRKEYMNLGLTLLGMCQAIAIMPECNGHTGCDMEIAYAKANDYATVTLTQDNIKEGYNILSARAYGKNPRPFSVVMSYDGSCMHADYRDGSGHESYPASSALEFDKAVKAIIQAASSEEN